MRLVWSMVRVGTPLILKHCGASMSKQYIVATNFYIAKALSVKLQSQHTGCGMWLNKVCHSTVIKSA